MNQHSGDRITVTEITCVLGKKVKFTKERYSHIISRHPEMKGKESEIIKTIKDADFVQRSIYDRQVLLYYRTTGKTDYCVVVVKVFNNHGFILTSYIAGIVKKGEVIWEK